MKWTPLAPQEAARLGGLSKGPDYRKGGIAAKGFADNPDRAREAGSKGGSKSKRKWTPEERLRHSQAMRKYWRTI